MRKALAAAVSHLPIILVGMIFASPTILPQRASAADNQEKSAPKGPAEVQAILDREIQRTEPDYIVFRPKSVCEKSFHPGASR